MAHCKSIRSIADQHGSRLAALGRFHAQKPRAGSDERSIDPVGQEIAENRVRRKGTVFTDFLGQFARAAGERFYTLGKLGLFFAFAFDLFLHFGDSFSCMLFLDFSDLKLAGKLLFFLQDHAVAFVQQGELMLEVGCFLVALFGLGFHRRELFTR